MPYDEGLAQRIREVLEERADVSERKMFGGLAFMVGGNMCVGVWKEFLIIRCGKDAYEDSLAQPHAREFDITGRAMSGWIMVEPDGFERESDLAEWVQMAVDFVNTLPAK